MLPVTTPAPSRARMGARRHDPMRRGGDHLHRVRAAERSARVLGDDRTHALTGQRVSHEHDATGEAGDTEPAVPGCAHVEFQ